MELPPETINSTLDAHDQINKWMDRFDIGHHRSVIHDLVDEAVRNAHLYAIAGAGSRILTIPEIADRLNISVETVRNRLAEASPPILPVKVIKGMRLFMVEDLPAIASAHMKGVIEDGQNTRYVAAKLRKAISQAGRTMTWSNERGGIDEIPSVAAPSMRRDNSDFFKEMLEGYE